MYYKMYLHKWVTTMATNWLLGVMNQPSEDINLLLHVLGVENYILYVSENWLKVCQYHWDNNMGSDHHNNHPVDRTIETSKLPATNSVQSS